VKSVAVKGDARAYEYVVSLRAVETVDFMTARWAQLPHEFLAHVSSRILNEAARHHRMGVARLTPTSTLPLNGGGIKGGGPL
jgi:GMP synthase PP-ATPase subunit